jgi:hypothetical protein
MGRLYHDITFRIIIFRAGEFFTTVAATVTDAAGNPSAVDPARIAASRSLDRHSSGRELRDRHPGESGFVVEFGRPDAI